LGHLDLGKSVLKTKANLCQVGFYSRKGDKEIYFLVVNRECKLNAKEKENSMFFIID
jgi:hypothetical protein